MTAPRPNTITASVVGGIAAVFLTYTAWLAIECIALLVSGAPDAAADVARWIVPTLLVAVVGFGGVAVCLRAAHTYRPARRAAVAFVLIALGTPAVVGLAMMTRSLVSDTAGYACAAVIAAALGFLVTRTTQVRRRGVVAA